jgi:gamma-glutamylcyclotransferase (GGCT)/AIG2-like uncharacterized protein YtfP
MHRLFVYGTLRRGCDNPWAQSLQQASEYEGPGTIAGSLYRIAGYPGWVLPEGDEPGGEVHGELWRPRDFAPLIAALDAYEGPEYQRELHPVRTASGQVLEAWVYRFVGSTEGKARIPSGDWLGLLK